MVLRYLVVPGISVAIKGEIQPDELWAVWCRSNGKQSFLSSVREIPLPSSGQSSPNGYGYGTSEYQFSKAWNWRLRCWRNDNFPTDHPISSLVQREYYVSWWFHFGLYLGS